MLLQHMSCLSSSLPKKLLVLTCKLLRKNADLTMTAKVTCKGYKPVDFTSN